MVARSQSFTASLLRLPVARRRLSAENVTLWTPSKCPVKVPVCCQSETRQSLAVPSMLPVASHLPSGLNATASVKNLCASSRASTAPLVSAQTAAFLPPTASSCPLAETQTGERTISGGASQKAIESQLVVLTTIACLASTTVINTGAAP